MDKNSVIGLLLIGGILLTFGLYNGPDEESAKTSKEKTILADSTKTNIVTPEIKSDENVIATTDVPVGFDLKMDTEGNPIVDSSTGLMVYTDSLKQDTVFTELKIEKEKVKLPEEFVTLKNDLIELEISTLGGKITKTFLNQFRNYDDYINEKDNALQLFDDKTTYGIEFIDGGKKKNTQDLAFSIEEQTTQSLKMVAKLGSKSVIFNYKLTDDSYDVDYSILFRGFDDADAQYTKFLANVNLLSTEKHLPSEQRASSIYFDDEGSYSYLGLSDDDLTFEAKTTWVSFKQSFFSAMIMKEDGFGIGSKIEAKKPLDIEVDSVYIRDYSAELNLDMKNMTNSVDLKWYFGPNDYDILAEHQNGSQDVVDLGWGLFRWINVYALRPMFKSFVGWGLGAGLAILLLTFIVKLILSPVNYKMYKSSAMMKVLKPEIADIQAKYPDKKDAMKKQQELMALYKDAGASPMAGCVPMLVQMPILFAIFRLFPSAIEMRQKGFLWAEDLSSYDSIYNLGFDIPFYGDHVSLFTLLMAGTTLVYTHFNSSNMQQPQQEGMPNMKYIMYFFPIMMIFFFNSYSAGLSFYYFISTLMTMLIMLAIKTFILDEKKIHAKIAANKAKPKKKKGKSKFAQRLEEAQKMQLEKQKSKKK